MYYVALILLTTTDSIYIEKVNTIYSRFKKQRNRIRRSTSRRIRESVVQRIGAMNGRILSEMTVVKKGSPDSGKKPCTEDSGEPKRPSRLTRP